MGLTPPEVSDKPGVMQTKQEMLLDPLTSMN